jgi:YD repeat-containing protein
MRALTAQLSPASATGDVTQWHYDQATGQLLSKQYADGSQVSYTYTTGGKLATRTWARQSNGQPLTTTYSYDPATGELIHIDYSDDTPDITFVYDRLGRQAQISDAAGTHSFSYNSSLQPDTETTTGIYDAVLTRTYATTGVVGRATGFNLGAGYSVTYGYDDSGRFNAVTWSADNQTSSAAYTYVPNSDLLQGLSSPGGSSPATPMSMTRWAGAPRWPTAAAPLPRPPTAPTPTTTAPS